MYSTSKAPLSTFLTCLAFLVLFSVDGFSQNLLANSSFEDENYCESQIPCSPSGWFSVSDMPSGYFKNPVKSLDGNNSLGFVVASSKAKARNYWQTQLLCNPRENKMILKFSLYSPSQIFNPAHFGFAFIEEMILSKKDSLLHLSDYSTLSGASIKQRKNGWYDVEVVIEKPANKQVLILGNFDTTTTAKSINNSVVYEGYYIDRISLESQDKMKCEWKAARDSLYSITRRHGQHSSTKPPIITMSKPVRSKIKIDTFLLSVENFDLNSSKIKKINSIDSILNSIDFNVVDSIYILGFTDNLGSVEYNAKLSLARAEAVREYIITKFDLGKENFLIEGRGISTKYASAELNRRAEIIIQYKKEE
jgi:outer membrane protein OmpA-like peptidoglycan-associated protein